MTLQAEQSRFHHLDALRAGALLIGILLHATLSYLPGYREANWPLADASTSSALGILYFVIHLFRMSLFFLIAGFFARLLHQRLGTRGLIKHRLRRIALPLLAFYLLLMPLVVVAMVWGARQLGIQAAAKPHYPIDIIGPAVPWGHLWFLYMLLVLYALWLPLRALVVRFDRTNSLATAVDAALDWALRTRVAPLLLGAPLAVALYLAPWWVQWQGIPSPIAGLVPNLQSLLAYGAAFVVGWLMHRRQELLRLLATAWPLYLAGALLGCVVALGVVGITPRLTVLALTPSERALYAGSYSLAHWCAVLGAIGFAQRWLGTPSARWRYLADASYWMYLVHLPVVMLLQAWMLRWPLHWSLKLALVLGGAAVVLLGSYHFLVRRTFIGVFLNGRKVSHAPRLDAAAGKTA